MNWTTRVVRYIFVSLKSTIHKSHLIVNQAVLVKLYVFDSLNNLTVNLTTLIVLYVVFKAVH